MTWRVPTAVPFDVTRLNFPHGNFLLHAKRNAYNFYAGVWAPPAPGRRNKSSTCVDTRGSRYQALIGERAVRLPAARGDRIRPSRRTGGENEALQVEPDAREFNHVSKVQPGTWRDFENQRCIFFSNFRLICMWVSLLGIQLKWGPGFKNGSVVLQLTRVRSSNNGNKIRLPL